jgi:carbon-monoxide dehydrogenase medium subunit
MIIPPFEYYSPANLAEALDILDEKRSEVLPLAGGTDILVMMKEGTLKPKGLLSLKKIEELKQVNKSENGQIEIGAGMTVTEIETMGISRMNPAFGDLIWEMATRQVRNRATIGGNLCTAAACADFPPVLLVNDATVLLRSKNKEREVPLETFFTGPRMNVRQDNELLVSIRFKQVNRGTAYIKFGVRKAVKISIVGIACALEVADGLVSDVKLASTAASPTPIVIEKVRDVVIGKPPVPDTWERAAAVGEQALSPIADLRGSADYRRQLGKVGTVRALDKAFHRLTEAQDV